MQTKIVTFLLTVCAPGYFGENCDSRCHCGVGGCDGFSGECYNQTAGCEVSWTGRNCSIRKEGRDISILTIRIVWLYNVHPFVKRLFIHSLKTS